MGYFSEMDQTIKQGKRYLEATESISRDRELSPQEMATAQIEVWELYGKPAPLTPEEIKAVLTDNIDTSAWETAIIKLTSEAKISPVTYEKRNNR